MLWSIIFPCRKCRVKRRIARRNKNINILNTEFKRTAKISNLEVAQVCLYILKYYLILYWSKYFFILFIATSILYSYSE